MFARKDKIVPPSLPPLLRLWLWLSWLGAVGLVGGCAFAGVVEEEEAAGAADGRPNILFILADDLGWTDLGSFGSEYYETPVLDSLAARGVRFTSAYASGPNCAPTRAILMTGQYAPRHGIYTVVTGARGRAANRELEAVPNKTELGLEFLTLAEMLRDQGGYETAFFGKWHLGEGPVDGPLEQGFDLNVGGNSAGQPKSYFSPYQNADLPDGPIGEQLTDRLTDEAIAFLKLPRDRPFFMCFSSYAVHTPLQAKADLVARYRKKPTFGGQGNPTYAAMIETLDMNVGRLIRTLEELGLRSNTLVIFTSDNGGVGGYAGLGVRSITDNAPLRGGKGMLYEGGIRVPMIVDWPGVTDGVFAGTERTEVVQTVDFYPTFAGLAGVAAADLPVNLDGVDLVPLLKGDGELWGGAGRSLFWHFPGYLEANVRLGTWRTTPVSVIRKGRYKLLEFYEDGGYCELYDLEADLGEKMNLVEQLPDVVEILRGELDDWRKAVGARVPVPVKVKVDKEKGRR